MSVRPYRDIYRRESRQIMVGDVPVGGDAPITVQSMTNALTSDARATLNQIREIEEAGADIIRVSCPDEDSTAAMPTICREAKVPIVADIHFHYKRALEAADAGAASLSRVALTSNVSRSQRGSVPSKCRRTIAISQWLPVATSASSVWSAAGAWRSITSASST